MIRYDLRDSVAHIVLDTPGTSNRFTYSLMNNFIAALASASASGAAVLAISAEGADFTLGRDQKEPQPDVGRRANLRLILRANELLQGFPGVSVALIHGRSMGFGTGIALHSDISVAARSAVFGFDEIVHGLAPLVVLDYLPRYVGPKVAKELVVTGRDVPAQEALALGLINRVVDDEDLVETGKALIARLSGFSPGALRLIQSFAVELEHVKGPDAGALAVDRLADWLEAGRPS
ncbi:enoyl-CoA hydratase/isomerase family protein [Beijerinckia sp. L45]|uniref:enoyl-CoA hydratase/isomerase family protein n=1 Tax=Beijerinckia sp. L45 TaxID=1641855 RepID=UPI00131D69DB|nr:enoyl-CoA hydratase/isomerase family protein [Beijerinckia sp. L45]